MFDLRRTSTTLLQVWQSDQGHEKSGRCLREASDKTLRMQPILGGGPPATPTKRPSYAMVLLRWANPLLGQCPAVSECSHSTQSELALRRDLKRSHLNSRIQHSPHRRNAKPSYYLVSQSEMVCKRDNRINSLNLFLHLRHRPFDHPGFEKHIQNHA